MRDASDIIFLVFFDGTISLIADGARAERVIVAASNVAAKAADAVLPRGLMLRRDDDGGSGRRTVVDTAGGQSISLLFRFKVKGCGDDGDGCNIEDGKGDGCNIGNGDDGCTGCTTEGVVGATGVDGCTINGSNVAGIGRTDVGAGVSGLRCVRGIAVRSIYSGLPIGAAVVTDESGVKLNLTSTLATLPNLMTIVLPILNTLDIVSSSWNRRSGANGDLASMPIG